MADVDMMSKSHLPFQLQRIDQVYTHVLKQTSLCSQLVDLCESLQ